MNLLPLDDPRWRELDHRNWHDGRPSEWVPNAPFVPDELAKLLDDPGDQVRFGDLWPFLCSEGTTYSAAYAATPYFVLLAKRLPPEQRDYYLTVVGLIVTDADPTPGPFCELKDYLVESYHRALDEALPLVTETLLATHDLTDTRYLLATVAALKGHRKLAAVLQDIDCICGECPKCGETVFPDALQAVIS